MSSESYSKSSSWDDVLAHSDRDIKNMKGETADMGEYFNKLKGQNENAKRRISNLQAETVALKSRMEHLMTKRTPNSPDYQEYQTMRQLSKTSSSSSTTVQRAISTANSAKVEKADNAISQETITEIQPQSMPLQPVSVTISVN